MIEAYAEPFLRSGQLVRVLEDWSPNITARNPASIAGAAPPGAALGSLMRPRNASTVTGRRS